MWLNMDTMTALTIQFVFEEDRKLNKLSQTMSRAIICNVKVPVDSQSKNITSVRVKEDSSEEMMFKLCFSALKLWDQFSKPIRVEVNCNKMH